jgi:hypothetical protein
MATSEARTALDNTGCRHASVADIYCAIVEISFAQLGSLLSRSESRSWDFPRTSATGTGAVLHVLSQTDADRSVAMYMRLKHMTFTRLGCLSAPTRP